MAKRTEKRRTLGRTERTTAVVVVMALTAFLTCIGSTDFKTWKFDAIILGGFLLGDYVMRWLLNPRNLESLLMWFRANTPMKLKLAIG